MACLLHIAHSQVEEIDDVDGMSYDPFIADAIANEGDLSLTEEQKRNFKKVSFIYEQSSLYRGPLCWYIY